MGNFFGNVYYLFVGLFGQHLSSYLWGYSCETMGYGAPVVYLPIGITMTLLTVVLCVLYYYVVNHPRFNKWWHWLICAGVVFVVNLLIGGIWTSSHLSDGLIPDCLRYDDTMSVEQITNFHCWMFGLANGIVSFIWFAILSGVIKRWSRNCRHTPWRSLFPKRNK